MDILEYKGKSYQIDEHDFLIDYDQWDENFVRGLAPKLNISGELTEKHWDVIRFIREAFQKTGECPLVYEACKSNGLSARDMRGLFPTGYMRGACKLSGISYKDRFINYYGEPSLRLQRSPEEKERLAKLKEKVYRVDVFGFLVDPSEWDEDFAASKARETKTSGGLTKKHFTVINYLRQNFEDKKIVPTVMECCLANGLELEELEQLFPDGYQRGAVKIAGLRVV